MLHKKKYIKNSSVRLLKLDMKNSFIKIFFKYENFIFKEIYTIRCFQTQFKIKLKISFTIMFHISYKIANNAFNIAIFRIKLPNKNTATTIQYVSMSR